MNITYSTNQAVSIEQFRQLLIDSTLGERRPIDNIPCLEKMLQHGDIIASAWDDDKLVGISRSVTDYSYCCYLSDLAVHRDYQRMGIGKMLIKKTEAVLDSGCSLILLAAPKANAYYEPIGFDNNPRCWVKPVR